MVGVQVSSISSYSLLRCSNFWSSSCASSTVARSGPLSRGSTPSVSSISSQSWPRSIHISSWPISLGTLAWSV